MWSVFFLFLSYLDGDLVKGELLGHPVDADKESKVVFHALSDALCAKTSTVGQFSLHQVSDGVQEVRSVRDPAGRLVRCSVSANETQVTAFLRACRLGLREQQAEPTGSELKLTGVVEAKANCEQLKSKDAMVAPAHAQSRGERQVPGADGAGEVQKLRRAKRGFTYPGTLWCGAGNIADGYDQLGEFTETDKCCRTHDHCPHVIHAFSSNYGYTNFKWHSLSHCDCDNALKNCLRVVNDTSSRVVGQAFFNVIEVPCFEFSFEEQCVERHWYGVCKRYDRVPVAVLRESIPYDFGGVDVIDVLTVAPPKKTDEDEKEKEQGSESTAQSSFSGSKSSSPEEPSLTNVVTAAEDFIKVLATVSTSQSSSADGGKGEAQASDKKRKKNAGKKKKDSKKRRGKGKGKKRKQNTDRVSKAEEGVAGAPSANRTEEVISKSHFVEDPGNFDRAGKNNGNFMTGVFDPVVDGGHSNKMMRDEYQRMPDEGQVSISTTPDAKQKEEEVLLETQKRTEDTASAQRLSTGHISSTVPSKPRSTRLRQRAERKRHRHPTPTPLPLETTLDNKMGDNTPLSATESTSLAGQTTRSPISPAEEEAPRSSEYRSEKGSAFIAATQNTPIVATKRLRSRQRGGRKRSRKLSTPSTPIAREVPHAFIAEEPSVLQTDATRVLTADPSPEPQSPSERLQPNRLENLAGSSARSTVGPSGEHRAKNRHQRSHGTRGRRGPQLPNANLSTKEDPRHEDRTTTTTIPSSTDTDSHQASAGQLFPLLQASVLTVSPLQTKPAKRRSREREDQKRRKNKSPEAQV
ncbi:uncharacterized protein proca1 [Salminus brasiliensis]|uniref:uncharacterized protein proca1 n=1 Tax=Salminus brasiliensis TaxID=930266 RepID=UPI003B839038